VVVAGGGFTGIEAATEMPARLRKILGPDAKLRVIIVERGPAIAPDMGAEPRPVIEKALRDCGVETRLGVGVAALDDAGVTLSDGTHIDSATVIWAAGMRAAPLTAQVPGERDNFGRLLVDRDLRVLQVAGVFATGDAAKAPCGRCRQPRPDVVPARDAARRLCREQRRGQLLGQPTRPYHQKPM
jgi:NADH dehydrogenase